MMFSSQDHDDAACKRALSVPVLLDTDIRPAGFVPVFFNPKEHIPDHHHGPVYLRGEESRGTGVFHSLKDEIIASNLTRLVSAPFSRFIRRAKISQTKTCRKPPHAKFQIDTCCGGRVVLTQKTAMQDYVSLEFFQPTAPSGEYVRFGGAVIKSRAQLSSTLTGWVTYYHWLYTKKFMVAIMKEFKRRSDTGPHDRTIVTSDSTSQERAHEDVFNEQGFLIAPIESVPSLDEVVIAEYSRLYSSSGRMSSHSFSTAGSDQGRDGPMLFVRGDQALVALYPNLHRHPMTVIATTKLGDKAEGPEVHFMLYQTRNYKSPTLLSVPEYFNDKDWAEKVNSAVDHVMEIWDASSL